MVSVDNAVLASNFTDDEPNLPDDSPDAAILCGVQRACRRTAGSAGVQAELQNLVKCGGSP